jgi:hypothetical protein
MVGRVDRDHPATAVVEGSVLVRFDPLGSQALAGQFRGSQLVVRVCRKRFQFSDKVTRLFPS